MTTTVAPSGELVRLTVGAAGSRRDLVLPARVPVVELVPELVGLLGVVGADGWGGWTVVGVDARPLDPAAGLHAQGVRDGAVLTLVASAELEALAAGRVHDDVAEAVADVVGGIGPRWGARDTAGSVRAAGGVLALLVLGGLVAQSLRDPAGRVIPVLCGAAAAGLLVVATVLDRIGHDARTALATLLSAVPYAAAAGATLASGDRLGWPLVGTGCAVAVVGLAGQVALRRGQWVLHVPVTLGLGGAALGLGHALSGVDAGRTAAVLVVAAVVVARVAPWLGLATTGPTLSPPGPPGPPGAAVSETRVRRSVGRVRRLVLGVRVGVALLVVLCAPLLVGLGWAGPGLVGAVGVVTVLGARRLVLRDELLVGVVGGGAVLVSGTVSVMVLRPDWAPALTAAGGAALAAALVALVAPARSGARSEQLLDLVEGLALGSLLPLVVVASGLVAAVRGAVG